ncbi:hypothetical protein PFISCL1PPCAC_28776 [Pristionchus fissidentatus]|uniref:G protein-coupled receptor n=1 Tax=Pristionchus fissidentatus TaxID=1538716 RepID=A0AAV5X500_9BILA|nr:hypothetical protein PFISCL1PPCAC_28776 [Pristionchus fissidentatus]
MLDENRQQMLDVFQMSSDIASLFYLLHLYHNKFYRTTMIPIVVHKVILFLNFIVSIVSNSLLLILLLNRASSALGNYRILLGIFAVVDIFFSIYHSWPHFLKRRFWLLLFIASVYTLLFASACAAISFVLARKGLNQQFEQELRKYGMLESSDLFSANTISMMYLVLF